jgi:hypothetical protein
MDPEEFEFTDHDLEVWLDGDGAATDSDMTRFLVDLRRQVESFTEEPSPKLASWIADSSRSRDSDTPVRANIAELDDIMESLMQLH